jgi:hypothetical protein
MMRLLLHDAKLRRTFAYFLLVGLVFRCGISNAQSEQTTHSICSPNISEISGTVTIVQFCTESIEDLRLNAHQNLIIAQHQIKKFISDNDSYFFPTIDQYLKEPTRANWEVIRATVGQVNEILEAVRSSMDDYEAERPASSKDALANVAHTVSRKRRAIIQLNDPGVRPMTPTQLKAWSDGYRADVKALMHELEEGSDEANAVMQGTEQP